MTSWWWSMLSDHYGWHLQQKQNDKICNDSAYRVITAKKPHIDFFFFFWKNSLFTIHSIWILAYGEKKISNHQRINNSPIIVCTILELFWPFADGRKSHRPQWICFLFLFFYFSFDILKLWISILFFSFFLVFGLVDKKPKHVPGCLRISFHHFSDVHRWCFNRQNKNTLNNFYVQPDR